MFLLLSCNGKKTYIDLSKADYIIEVNEKDFSKTNKLSELIDSIEYIPLETSKNCLIGRVDKIKWYNDNIYVYDEIAQTVFLFNINGEFISKYDKIGKGPYEYIELNDIDIDSKGNCYLLETRKIIKLDSALNPIEEIQLPFGTLRFAIHDENIILVNYGMEDEIHILTSNGKEITSFFPYWETERNVRSKPFIKYGSKLFYQPIHKDNIYKISSDSVSLHTKIIFEKPLPEEFWIKNNDMYKYPGMYIMNGVYIYCENESFIIFNFSYDTKQYDGPSYVLYSKKSGKSVIYTNEIENDCYLSKYPPFIDEIAEDGRFIAVIDASFFSEAMKNNQSSSIGEYEVTEMSNPVIALIKFKEL